MNQGFISGIFETFNSTNWNVPKYSLFSFTIFFDLEEIIFENFNIFENNMISVELAQAFVQKLIPTQHWCNQIFWVE